MSGMATLLSKYGNSDYNLSFTLNAISCVNGYIFAMQVPYILIPMILVRRCGFTLIVTSTIKIITFGVQKILMNLWKVVHTLKK